MQSIIFIIYILLFTWLTTIIPFFKNAGIGKWLLIALFISKITAGFAYAWFYSLPQNIHTADTWKFYNASLTETAWLLHDPSGFVKDYFHSPYQQSSNLFSGVSSYWNDLDYNTFVKGMAVINVFTNKNYYTNILFYNFIYLFGPVALYRLVKPFWIYNNLWLILPVFLLPSFLFWCSGVHKDGLLFSAMMISIYCFYVQVKQHRFLWKHSAALLICFMLLFALRNVILLLLLPSLAALFFSEQKPRYQWQIFISIYAAGLLLFFTAPIIAPILNFPQYIISKQAEFNTLTGSSKIDLPALQPSYKSFAKFFPHAIDLAFLRPHINEIKGFSYLLAFLENGCAAVIIILWLLFHKPLKSTHPLLLCFLFFSVSVLLLCGYTVTFLGAIVRYKSIVTPLLVTCLLLDINYRKLSFKKLIK